MKDRILNHMNEDHKEARLIDVDEEGMTIRIN